MTNFEHYKDYFIKILKEKGSFNIGLVKGKPKRCNDILCSQCDFHDKSDFCSDKVADWFKEEYKEPGIDWTKVPVDTKILVRDIVDGVWTKRYFAKYDEQTSKVFVWLGGGTSWTTTDTRSWDYAKLAEEESE